VTPDEITLTLPRQKPFYRIAHLVLGGLGVRLDLTFEYLEDLQLALAGLLERHDGDHDVTLSVRIDDGSIRVTIGPFSGDDLRRELESDSVDDLSLGRLLDTVVDEVQTEEREGGVWVEVTKSVAGRTA
jgi:anti-sigma regulatory factor (Ser/Thr protein kinase)